MFQRNLTSVYSFKKNFKQTDAFLMLKLYAKSRKGSGRTVNKIVPLNGSTGVRRAICFALNRGCELS